MFGNISIKKDQCKGCEYCVIYCPKKCIKMSEKINVRGVHYAEFIPGSECISCRICARVCPDVCIEVFEPTGSPLYRKVERTISQFIDSSINKLRNVGTEKKSEKDKK